MKQITDKESLIGKTVTSCGESDNAFGLVFSDETFCIFSGCGYGDWEVELSEDEINLDPSGTDRWTLVRFGIIDESVAREADRLQHQNWEKTREEDERRQYLVLKRKFEGQK